MSGRRTTDFRKTLSTTSSKRATAICGPPHRRGWLGSTACGSRYSTDACPERFLPIMRASSLRTVPGRSGLERTQVLPGSSGGVLLRVPRRWPVTSSARCKRMPAEFCGSQRRSGCFGSSVMMSLRQTFRGPNVSLAYGPCAGRATEASGSERKATACTAGEVPI